MEEVSTSGMSRALAAWARARALALRLSNEMEPTHPMVPTWWSISSIAVFSVVKDNSDMMISLLLGRVLVKTSVDQQNLLADQPSRRAYAWEPSFPICDAVTSVIFRTPDVDVPATRA